MSAPRLASPAAASIVVAALLIACTGTRAPAAEPVRSSTHVGTSHAQAVAQAAVADSAVVFPTSVQQGAMVIGKVPAGSTVQHGGRRLRVTPYGSVVFGVARDEAGPARLLVTLPGGREQPVSIEVVPRDWPAETIRGAPKQTVKPSPAVAARIQREQALVSAARVRDDARTGFAEHFQWPVRGRISGRFGSHRVYLLPDGSGSKGSSHSGMDIAAPTGTPVLAPAAGVVTFADPDLYLTGGTILLDHGHGISSNFLHLSRLDVRVGDAVSQGEVIGAVGATGRATGPHLHWGMNWFDVRIDPLLVLERGEQARPAGAP
ncbi:MAG: M23 family metallopeptidase [Lysobacter sp.]|nr:M23 family metallopeptidase [Lysobacter sp.]MDQ3269703.1 M23 family metallopeptidase [Pseudomonadota bacterium]